MMLALTATALGCGEAYSTHVPSQKSRSQMALLPDNARIGDTFDLQIVIFTPGQTSYVSDFNFGTGIDVLFFDTGTGGACHIDLGSITMPELFETTYAFPVCMTVLIQPDSPLGERTIAIDVESAGVPILARAPFYVLPAFPFE